MKRFFAVVLALVLVSMLGSASHVSAATGGTQFYKKGNSYSRVINGSDIGKETLVFSVSAQYNKSTGGGMTNVRTWSRSANVSSYYSIWGYKGMNNLKTRFYSYDPNKIQLSVNNSTPSPSQDFCYGNLFASLVADIIGYVGFPNNTVGYLTSEWLACGGNDFYSAAGVGYDKTIEIDAGWGMTLASSSALDLPASVSYTEADPFNNDAESGIGTWFNFYLDPTYTSHKVSACSSASYLFYDRANEAVMFTRTTGNVCYPFTIN